MKASTALVTLISAAWLVCGQAKAGDDHGHSNDQHGDQIISIPFFVEDPSFAPTFGYRIMADLTLPFPAMLESYALTCAGTGAYSADIRIDTDTPVDYHGVTLTTTDPNSAVAKQIILIPTPMTAGPAGGTAFPLSRMHVPVKAKLSAVIFVEGSKNGQCTGYAQFRRE